MSLAINNTFENRVGLKFCMCCETLATLDDAMRPWPPFALAPLVCVLCELISVNLLCHPRVLRFNSFKHDLELILVTVLSNDL